MQTATQTAQAAKFQPGAKVVFDGRTNIINDKVFAGLTGTVDFECLPCPVSGARGLVYVNFLLAGKRKPRCVALHHESLSAVAA